MKRNVFLLLFASMALLAFAQAKKPTIMVVPDDPWCTEHGYVQEFTNQGKTTMVTDYERAVRTDMDLVNAITKVGELMTERGMNLKDLQSIIQDMHQSNAEDEMTKSLTSGATLAETPYEKLLNRAKADIVIKLQWRINTSGPRASVTYTLKGIDSYTKKQIAAATGTGQPSSYSEPALLLEEACVEKMDAFVAQLQAHFEDLLENGREVSINVRMFDNGSGISFNDEYGDSELTDVIDDWMAENTVNHRYNLSDASDYVLRFEQVRIPLYRPNGRPMDTRSFVNQLKKYLANAPYNLTSKSVLKGLGHADLVIGEK